MGCSNGGTCTEFLSPPTNTAISMEGEVSNSMKKEDSVKEVKGRKRKCCMCSSHSIVASVQTMARNVQHGFVGYELMHRHFCSKHAPPCNMVHHSSSSSSNLLLDDRQAMELAMYRDASRKKRRFN